jgi:hypothetical protein
MSTGKEFSEYYKPEHCKPRNIVLEPTRGTPENIIQLKTLDKWIVYN